MRSVNVMISWDAYSNIKIEVDGNLTNDELVTYACQQAAKQAEEHGPQNIREEFHIIEVEDLDGISYLDIEDCDIVDNEPYDEDITS